MTSVQRAVATAGGEDGPRSAGARAPLRVATVIARLEGGAGMLALRSISALDKGRFTSTIVTGSGDALIRDARERGIEVLIVPTLVAPIAPAQDRRAYVRLSSLLADREFDVVHTHCSKAGAVGRLAAHRATTSAIVHTYHGFAFHAFQSPARRGAYIRVERYLGRFTEVALCVGNAVAVEAMRLGLVAPDRIRTIGTAVDDQVAAAASLRARDPASRQRARAELGLAAAATVVGAVGRLTYQKAPEDFVAAIARLRHRDVVGVWVGGGELAAHVASVAARLAPGRVVLAGERGNVLDLMPAFDALALTSRYEGLPTVIVEAMLCGVPVVATAVNAVPDLVVHGETGLLVPPGKPEQVAAALDRLLADPATATRLATRARSHVGDRFGVAAVRDALSAAYDEVSTGRPAKSSTARRVTASRR